MTEAIERQIERFAPGFRERILGRHTMNTSQLTNYNPNYIGGDINGGALLPSQLFTRPALRWSPYRTSARGIYICSSSTRSEEHTSELQVTNAHIVCRLLLEKKNKANNYHTHKHNTKTTRDRHI